MTRISNRIYDRFNVTCPTHHVILHQFYGSVNANTKYPWEAEAHTTSSKFILRIKIITTIYLHIK